jgi:hypothetical protein
VGSQVSLDGTSVDDFNAVNALVSIASTGSVGLVVHAFVNGGQRGYYLSALGTLQSDRASETVAPTSLALLAAADSEQTWTLVPIGTGERIEVNRGEDGYFDRDEIDAGTDPANPRSCPVCCRADLSGDGELDFLDASAFIELFLAADPRVDFNGDGHIDFIDVSGFLVEFNAGCP